MIEICCFSGFFEALSWHCGYSSWMAYWPHAKDVFDTFCIWWVQ